MTQPTTDAFACYDSGSITIRFLPTCTLTR
jgi:hypothetical protein